MSSTTPADLPYLLSAAIGGKVTRSTDGTTYLWRVDAPLPAPRIHVGRLTIHPRAAVITGTLRGLVHPASREGRERRRHER
jgi:hypothetical protein